MPEYSEIISPPSDIATKAILISQQLHLGENREHKQWDVDQNIYIDYTDATNRRVSEAIVANQQLVAQRTSEALAMEARVLSSLKGEDIAFNTIEEYLAFLSRQVKVSIDPQNLQVRNGYLSGLISHWNSVKKSFKYEGKGPKTIDDFIESPSHHRNTRWYTLAYYEEFEQGGKIVDKKGISKDDTVRRQDFFTTIVVTHSTTVASAHAIMKSGFIESSDRNNFSASGVVADARTPLVTFVIDINDLFAAVPLVFGQSTINSEKEITSHFPVDIRLVRAVIPSTAFAESQQWRGYIDSYNLDIEGSKLHKLE